MFPSELLVNASVRKDLVIGIRATRRWTMTFHSLSPLLLSQFMRSSQKEAAVTTVGCTTCSPWSLHVLCVISVRWYCLGRVRRQGFISLMRNLAQVSVAAISRVRWSVFGVRISLMVLMGVNQLFMHTKNTTLSLLCHGVDGRGSRTGHGAQGVRGAEGGWGTNFRE